MEPITPEMDLLNMEVLVLDENKSNNNEENPTDLKGFQHKHSDRWNIFLLIVLYTLQRVPMALGGALPLILQTRGITYAQQAGLSLMHSPFAFKLLFAPLVDLLHIPGMGKRKSWIIPSQYSIGILLFITSLYIEDWISGAMNESKNPNILALASIFFLCALFNSFQDIAVDGWSLTLLRKDNVGHAVTCFFIGGCLGSLCGYFFFILLTSEKFCNQWFRTTPQKDGIFSISTYIAFWSIIVLVMTTLILLLTKEADQHGRITAEEKARHSAMSVFDSYKIIYQILTLKPVQILVLILLTCKVAFLSDSVFQLKLIDAGVRTDQIALLTMPLMPLQAFMPIIMKRYLVGSWSLNCFMHSYQFRSLFMVVVGVMVYYVPKMIQSGHLTPTFYVIYLLVHSIDDISLFALSMSTESFFVRVSDYRFGGTYLTLLNTMHNLGGKWPRTLGLWMVDYLTWQSCTAVPEYNFNATQDNSTFTTQTMPSHKQCSGIDGYYIEIAIGVVFGLIWLHFIGKNLVQKLQQFTSCEWLVNVN